MYFVKINDDYILDITGIFTNSFGEHKTFLHAWKNGQELYSEYLSTTASTLVQ